MHSFRGHPLHWVKWKKSFNTTSKMRPVIAFRELWRAIITLWKHIAGCWPCCKLSWIGKEDILACSSQHRLSWFRLNHSRSVWVLRRHIGRVLGDTENKVITSYGRRYYSEASASQGIVCWTFRENSILLMQPSYLWQNRFLSF